MTPYSVDTSVSSAGHVTFRRPVVEYARTRPDMPERAR